MTLDGNGNAEQITETTPQGSTTVIQGFDDLDRLEASTDRFGRTLGYGYDANGNRKCLTDHRNQQTVYDYDELNRLTEVAVTGAGQYTYDYYPDGRLEQVNFANGTQTTYAYDRADRIDTIAHRQGSTEVAFYDYDYDANGNRMRQTERNGALANNAVTEYAYDLADRLTEVRYPEQTHTYDLDQVGNRITETISGASTNTRTFGYNTRDQLETVTDTEGLDLAYSYDPSGNQLSKTDSGALTEYSYSARNRMITVSGASQATYTYDHNGFRVQKDTNNITARYLYDDQSLIAETNVLGNTLARYHYGSDRRLAEERTSQLSTFMQDALGTPIAIASNGTVQARYRYDAWGNLQAQEGTSEQPFGFTGYQQDDETELYYAQQRYYDSFTGRFLREDPFEGDVNTPPSLHRYLYANVNPLVFVDRNGLCAMLGAPGGDSLLGCAWDWITGNVSEGASEVVDASIGNVEENGLFVDMGGPTHTINPFFFIGVAAQAVENNPDLVLAPAIAKPFLRGRTASAR